MAASTLADVISTARPDTPAVVAGSDVWTYADLARESERLAAQLRGVGAGRESVVALELSSSPRFIAAAVACSLVEAAFMPMDLKDPQARRDQMTRVARPAAVVTETEIRPVAGSERLAARLAPQRGLAAYVSFTSGSTGVPKAVVTEHAAVINYIEQSAARYGLGPADRQLQLSSVTFDIAVDEIFSTLHAGATLVLRDPDFVYASVEEFLDLCDRRRITVLNMPTGLWNRFGAELAERPGHRLPAELRLVVVGGESASSRAVGAWHGAADRPDFRIVNAYGPTEAAVSVTFADLVPDRPIEIGSEIDGVTITLVDSDLKPVNPGDIGELVISGVGPARGYLDHAGEGFLDLDGAWSYRSGDLARREASGQLSFHGRADDQIKVRGGYRVQLSEVQQVLRAHPAVTDAVVVALPRGHAKVLGALVVAKDHVHGAALEELLRRFAAQHLPAWMVPSAIATASQLPLTDRGKVDHDAAVGLVAGVNVAQTAETASDLTSLVEEAWTTALGSAPQSGDANFFEEGGDSLAALELIEILSSRAGVSLPITNLYRSPTFADLLESVEANDTTIPTAHHVSGRTLVKLRKGGAGRLWCFLPPLSGAVTRYASMAHLLPPRDAVWAMETPADLSGSGMQTLVEGLGDAFLDADLTSFDTVVFSGYSLGGVFAHELAARVRAQLPLDDVAGLRVQALLLDPPDPAEPQMTLLDAFDIFVRVGWRIPEPCGDFITAEGQFDLPMVARAARRAGSLAASARDHEISDAWEVYASNTRILDDHDLSPGVQDTRILQCRENETLTDEWAPTKATGSWGAVLDEGQASAVPVEHFQLMEPPNDGTVARWLVHESDSVRRAHDPATLRVS